MDKDTARAVSLALAVSSLTPPYTVKSLFHWADRFLNYIQMGKWPKEAVNQIGKQEGQEGEGNESLYPNGKVG